ncbi:MAG: signal peptidase I, partial [Tenericutes bacterium]|nr:signal peptidase I [Mycoplasmatota bacterium]
LLYYSLTYLTVFFWGILKNQVSINYHSFINNILPFSFIIIFTELLRFIIIRKGRGYKSIWVVSIFLFTLMEITLKIKGYNFNLGIDIIKFSIEVLAVTFIKNIFLCYLTNRIGYKGTILYRFLLDIPLYILPFFPNLGIFIDSVFKMILPTIILFILLFKYSTNERNVKSKNDMKKLKIITTTIITVLIFIVVALSSTKFKYFTIVVGSGSMKPSIDMGDVVLIKRIKDINLLKENDILIFKHDKVTVIHRIIKIELNEGKKEFYTKGDANNSEDNYPIIEKDIIGTAIFKVKYLGYPTVWINSKINQ